MAVTLNVYEDIVKVLQKNPDYPIRVCVEGNSCFKQVTKEQKHEPTHNSSSMLCPEDSNKIFCNSETAVTIIYGGLLSNVMKHKMYTRINLLELPVIVQ